MRLYSVQLPSTLVIFRLVFLQLVIFFGFYHNKSPLNHQMGGMLFHFFNQLTCTSKQVIMEGILDYLCEISRSKPGTWWFNSMGFIVPNRSRMFLEHVGLCSMFLGRNFKHCIRKCQESQFRTYNTCISLNYHDINMPTMWAPTSQKQGYNSHLQGLVRTGHTHLAGLFVGGKTIPYLQRSQVPTLV